MRTKTFIGAVALGVALFGAPAFATTDVPMPATSYSGAIAGGASGTDAFGNPWLWSKTTLAKGASSPGPGFSVWGTPGLGDGNATYKFDTPAIDFGVVFFDPFDLKLAINETPTNSVQGFTEWTRFESYSGGVFTQWTPNYISPQQVDFVAPVGVDLTFGQQYFVNIVFTEKNITGAVNTGFLATFSGSVPEPSTWAMLGIGFAGIGLLGATKRRKAPRYAL